MQQNVHTSCTLKDQLRKGFLQCKHDMRPASMCASTGGPTLASINSGFNYLITVNTTR